MSDSTKDLKPVERQLRRLVAVIVEEAERNSDFAAKLSKVLSPAGDPHVAPASKPTPSAFNPVDILHREGRDALQRQLDLKTDSELTDILRKQGLWKRKGEKQEFNRSEAVQNIIANAERRLHQGSAFLQSGPGQQSSP